MYALFSLFYLSIYNTELAQLHSHIAKFPRQSSLLKHEAHSRRIAIANLVMPSLLLMFFTTAVMPECDPESPPSSTHSFSSLTQLSFPSFSTSCPSFLFSVIYSSDTYKYFSSTLYSFSQSPLLLPLSFFLFSSVPFSSCFSSRPSRQRTVTKLISFPCPASVC